MLAEFEDLLRLPKNELISKLKHKIPKTYGSFQYVTEFSVCLFHLI